MKWLFSLPLLLFGFISFGQNEPSDSTRYNFAQVEELPYFSSCGELTTNEDKKACFNKVVLKTVSKNVKYPAKCKRKGIQGKVYVSFIVEKNGEIRNIEVVRGIHKDLDKEAKRVIGLIPDAIPARQKGEKVRIQYTLPINFRLE